MDSKHIHLGARLTHCWSSNIQIVWLSFRVMVTRWAKRQLSMNMVKSTTRQKKGKLIEAKINWLITSNINIWNDHIHRVMIFKYLFETKNFAASRIQAQKWWSDTSTLDFITFGLYRKIKNKTKSARQNISSRSKLSV